MFFRGLRASVDASAYRLTVIKHGRPSYLLAGNYGHATSSVAFHPHLYPTHRLANFGHGLTVAPLFCTKMITNIEHGILLSPLDYTP